MEIFGPARRDSGTASYTTDYDNSPGEIMNHEVIITSDGNYRLLYMGKEKRVNAEQCMLPIVIHELSHLKSLNENS